MTIKVNLYRDWIKLILTKIASLKTSGFSFEEYEEWEKRKLKSYRMQIDQLEKANSDTKTVELLMEEDSLHSQYDMEQIHTYLDFEYRIIEAVPRKIRYASDFLCPAQYIKALAQIKDEIRHGISLFPRLSRQILNASQQDGMLFDWGIYHLHLGLARDLKRPMLLEGTKEVLYLIVDENTAYFLVIADHGKWANKDILRIVKRDFPEKIDPYEMKGIIGLEHEYSEKDHLNLRKNGLNTITELDGRYYLSPGGGINSARGSLLSTTRLQQIIHWFDVAEKLINEHLEKLIYENPNKRVRDLCTIELTMESLQNDRIVVFDRSNGIRVDLLYTKDRKEYEQIILNVEDS